MCVCGGVYRREEEGRGGEEGCTGGKMGRGGRYIGTQEGPSFTDMLFVMYTLGLCGLK